MKHRLNAQQWLMLLPVMLGASVGDTLLARGMGEVGRVQLSHPLVLLQAVFNPWVALGILCLLGFFASYITALSWADVSFVLPATAFGNVVVALLSFFWLHEHINRYRWSGIFLIVAGVGFVANGPSSTHHAHEFTHILYVDEEEIQSP